MQNKNISSPTQDPSRWVFLYKLKGYDTVFASFAYETKEEAELAAYGQRETIEVLTLKEITF